MSSCGSNTAIAGPVVVTPGAVDKHVASIFARLGPEQSDTDSRRVLAVLRYLGGRHPRTSCPDMARRQLI
jgi:hypothetical protein